MFRDRSRLEKKVLIIERMKFLRYEYVTSENPSLLNFEIFIFPNLTNIFRFEHVAQFILEKVFNA